MPSRSRNATVGYRNNFLSRDTFACVGRVSDTRRLTTGTHDTPRRASATRRGHGSMSRVTAHLTPTSGAHTVPFECSVRRDPISDRTARQRPHSTRTRAESCSTRARRPSVHRATSSSSPSPALLRRASLHAARTVAPRRLSLPLRRAPRPPTAQCSWRARPTSSWYVFAWPLNSLPAVSSPTYSALPRSRPYWSMLTVSKCVMPHVSRAPGKWPA